MSLFEKLVNRQEKIAIIGLGYVGIPLAVAFAKCVDVIGFDTNARKIEMYKSGFDPTNEIGDQAIKQTTINFTSDSSMLKQAKLHIVAVPTPINSDKTPDLTPVINASSVVGSNLAPGSIVVFESTVYPGVTENICIPILEKESGLKSGLDFKVGYSPERINPGDKVHRLENIIKIVSAMDEDSLDEISNIYELIIEAGVHKVSSIKVAEAAKVVENSQRDINIAFMNELAMVFDLMGIDTKEVIEAMNTKWNSLKFYPGLVGGHCIGVDPYYFIYEAERLGYHSQIILAGRKINDGMGKFVSDAIIKNLILAGKVVKTSKIAILGLTFKENVSDVRNSKVFDIIENLNLYGLKPIVADCEADTEEVHRIYGIHLTDVKAIKDVDCLVLAVAHNLYKNLSLYEIDSLFGPYEYSEKVIIDIKGILNKSLIQNKGYRYWRL